MRTLDKRRKWIRVRRGNPCPICGHIDFCTVADDGLSVHCMRIESTAPCGGSMGGWFHDKPEDARVPVPSHVDKPPAPKIDNVGALADRLYATKGADALRRELAEAWSVRLPILERMRVGMGYCERGRRYASFPSVDGDGKVVGITRRFDDGLKLTYRGTSNAGVFVPRDWESSFGTWIWIVEGASDVAVLLNEGAIVIGRPSNVGGVFSIRKLLAKIPHTRVVVVGENDRKPDRPGTRDSCPKDCRGCPWCFPGKFGAKEVAKRIGANGYLMPPAGIKDVRDWQAKAGGQVLASLIEATSQHLIVCQTVT